MAVHAQQSFGPWRRPVSKGPGGGKLVVLDVGSVVGSATQPFHLNSRTIRKYRASGNVSSNAWARAHSKARNVIYSKSIWKPLMSVIKIVPKRIFKRMKF